jgi:hypothetical protein
MGAVQIRTGIAPLALTVFSGAKRIVVRCGGCRKSTERLSGEPHADRHVAKRGGTSFHLDPFLRKTFTADAPTVYASA